MTSASVVPSPSPVANTSPVSMIGVITAAAAERRMNERRERPDRVFMVR
jgi:hypothetical protein